MGDQTKTANHNSVGVGIKEGTTRSTLDAIPEELKALPQWVLWNPNDERTREKDGVEGCKIPLNPATLRNASSTDPTTWGTFEQVETMVAQGYGIGFVLTKEDPYVCIDLDHVIDGGKLSLEAAQIVKQMDTYTEISPSGKGLHLWCRAVKPGTRSRGGIVELYDSGRYIRMSGNGENAIRDAQDALEGVYSRYMGKDTGEVSNGLSAPLPQPRTVSLSAQEVIARAERSVNGAKFASLMRGDTSAYGGDHSAADLALCSILAFFSEGDPALVDEVFRSSGLMRGKWDEKHGAQTYGEMTIAKALEQKGYYSVAKREPQFPQTATPEESTGGDQTDRPTAESYQAEDTTAIPDLKPISAYMADGFLRDVDRFASYKPKETGFERLDGESRGLYPGLYVIGALSSLGKTTFALNIADRLATNGTPVLFFSLEQSRFELFSKIVAKRTFEPITQTGVDALSIRSGSADPRVFKAENAAYEECAPNLVIAECAFDATAVTIRQSVDAYIEQTGEKPVVFVDYLQILNQIDKRMDPRKAVDYSVHTLKKMQADHDLTVIVISSVNRTNYLTPIDFESFKESGGIEYTADVVWGLQFSCLNEELFTKDKRVKEKRDRINEARAETPRKIDLVCLKNRYGKAFYTVPFLYTPAYDVYREV